MIPFLIIKVRRSVCLSVWSPPCRICMLFETYFRKGKIENKKGMQVQARAKEEKSLQRSLKAGTRRAQPMGEGRSRWVHDGCRQ